MNFALETIAAQATAPGTTGANMTPVAGDSLRIRQSSKARLLDLLGSRQGAGLVRITSPLMHDNVVGMTLSQPVGKSWMRMNSNQLFVNQDTLTVFGTGSTTAGDVELNALTILYNDIPGIQGNFESASGIRERIEDMFWMRTTITPTGVGWSGSIAITALDDQLKANRKYAWIGVSDALVNVSNLAVGMTSPDWGNLRIAAPVNNGLNMFTGQYFQQLSSLNNGIPCIPVFSANQKSNIFLTVLSNENSVAGTYSLLLVLLKDKDAKGKLVRTCK